MADREKVINELVEHIESALAVDSDYVDCVRTDLLQTVVGLLKEEQPKTGHWIYKKYDDMFMCSCCEKYSIRNDYPYCHWCGAKMEGR